MKKAGVLWPPGRAWLTRGRPMTDTRCVMLLHQPHSLFTKFTLVLESPFQPLAQCSPPFPESSGWGPAQGLRSPASSQLIPWLLGSIHPWFLAVSTGYTHSEKERKTQHFITQLARKSQVEPTTARNSSQLFSTTLRAWLSVMPGAQYLSPELRSTAPEGLNPSLLPCSQTIHHMYILS